MPAWTTPKTNWEGTDYFGRTAWLRISGNTEYLADILGIPFTPIAMVSDGSVLSSADRNNITDTLETIYATLCASWNRRYVLPRVDYGCTWNSKDLNAIENLQLNAKAQIDGTISNTVEYYAGEEAVCGDTISVGLL